MRTAFTSSPLTLLAAMLGATLGAGCGDVTPLATTDVPERVDDREHVQLTGIAAEELPAIEPLGPPYPIILVHGFSGFTDLGPMEYFFGIKELYEAQGADVTTPALPPYNDPAERARVLADVIDQTLSRTNKAKVHLIGHSQGGIDSRVVIAELGYARSIASFTSISTPHDGTEVATLADAAPEGVLNPAGQFLAWAFGLLEGSPPDEAAWANEDSEDAWEPDMVAAVRALTPDAMRALRARAPIPTSVPFFTIAGVSNLRSLDNADCAASLWPRPDRVDAIDPFLLASGAYLSFTDGGNVENPTPNDGLVTARSARDPQSTFLGCVPADHLDEVGLIADLTSGLVSGFDHEEMFLRLLDQIRSVEQ
ncbi:MAG: alpha/beta fold hydrolase [Deltaproteobacteria bacterium]|nr:alpha/beta fold hydrolase [Deltaproteobacteria bacterium]